ncbi:uncharacterized protein METZ01_LOCUS114722, partial [marine metagenome]
EQNKPKILVGNPPPKSTWNCLKKYCHELKLGLFEYTF